MRKVLGFAAALMAVLLLPFVSHAFTYSDGEVSVHVPEGKYVYYYTPEDTNFVGSVLSQALSEDGLLVKTGVYDSSGELRYSLDITRIPVNESADETVLKQGRADLLKTQMQEDFSMSDAEEEAVLGKSALVMRGGSLENPDYGKDVYVLKEGQNLYVVTLFYNDTEEGGAYQQALSQMNTIRFGDVGPAGGSSARLEQAKETAVPQSVSAEPAVSPETAGPTVTKSADALAGQLEDAGAKTGESVDIAPVEQADTEKLVPDEAEPRGGAVPIWVFVCAAIALCAAVVVLLSLRRGKTKNARHMGSFQLRRKPAHYRKHRRNEEK